MFRQRQQDNGRHVQKLSPEAKYGIIALFAFATYGFTAFNLTLAGDDWYYLHGPDLMRDWFLRIDRWMALPLWDLFYANKITAPLSIILLLVSLVVAGMRLCALLDIYDPWQQIIFCCLFLSCPILIEHMQFKINHIQLAFAVLACVLSIERIWDANTEPALRIMPVGLLLLAIGTLQVTVIMFGTLAVFVLLDRALRRDALAIEIRRFAVTALTGLAALVLALAIGALIKTVLDLPAVPERDIHALHLVSSLEQLKDSFHDFARYVSNFYFGAQIGWPLASKLAFLFFAMVLLVSVLLRPIAASRKALVLILFAVFLLAPFALGLVRTGWSSYRYTATFPLMLICPLVIGIVLRDPALARFSKVLMALAAFVLLQFSQNHNHAAIGSWANNQRDRFEAMRILDALTPHMDQQVSTIYVVGRLNTPRVAPFWLSKLDASTPAAQTFIINECTVLTCQPRHLANVIRGITYFPITPEIEEIRPGEYATKHPNGPKPVAFWPSEKSVVRDGEALYLFLSL